jgi:hypothetical protein
MPAMQHISQNPLPALPVQSLFQSLFAGHYDDLSPFPVIGKDGIIIEHSYSNDKNYH